MLLLVAPGLLQRLQCKFKWPGACDARLQQRIDHLLQRFEKSREARRIVRLPGQTALGQLLQQLARRMFFIAEEPRIGQRKAQQRGLEMAHQFLDRRQQPRILRDVVDHQGHHLQAQGLAGAARFLLHLRAQDGAAGHGAGEAG